MTAAELGSGWTGSPGFCLHLRQERPVCICVLWAAEGEAASLTHIQYTLENPALGIQAGCWGREPSETHLRLLEVPSGGRQAQPQVTTGQMK